MTDTPAAQPIDITSALAENALARAELMAAIDALPPERRSEPAFDGWSVEDLVRHLAIWQEAAAAALQQMAAGERPVVEGFTGDNIDEWNDARVEAARDLGWEQSLGRLRTAREAFEAAVRHAGEALPPGRLVPGKTAAGLIVGNGAEHDREHGGQILAWRREHGI
jgi:uncharacterized damage-inducible protein DinB